MCKHIHYLQKYLSTSCHTTASPSNESPLIIDENEIILNEIAQKTPQSSQPVTLESKIFDLDEKWKKTPIINNC